MNGLSPIRAGRLTASQATGRAAYPELTFRALPPSEALLMLAREQDALCRAVHPLDAASARVSITREAERGTMHEVMVRASDGGLERCGSGRHANAEVALRVAYSELLRALVLATPCPCQNAA